MNGRIVASALAASAVVAGGAMYWLQIYAFYAPVVFTPPDRFTMEGPGMVPVTDLRGIDADSSPQRFRACFTMADRPEGLRPYDGAVPLTAPGWFDCFDAAAIGHGLERGEAQAFLAVPDIHPDVDRVVAIFPDGRAFAWHQMRPERE